MGPFVRVFSPSWLHTTVRQLEEAFEFVHRTPRRGDLWQLVERLSTGIQVGDCSDDIGGDVTGIRTFVLGNEIGFERIVKG